MNDSPKPTHAYTGPASGRPEVPQPTHAERVRTLLHVGGSSTLATMSCRHPGYPFGSLMPYGFDDDGTPSFLISKMAMHTQNILADSRATLLVVQASTDGNTLGAARASILGDVRRVAEDAMEAVRATYLEQNPQARYWVDFDDFHFYQMDVVEVYFVGGFGVMGWVSADEYRTAKVDPLVDVAAGIMEHMNADHEEALIALSKAHAGLDASAATMTAIDRLGFHVRLKTAEGMKGARIGFPTEVRSAAESRTVLVKMVRSLSESASD